MIGDLVAEWLAFAVPVVAVWCGWHSLFDDKLYAVWGHVRTSVVRERRPKRRRTMTAPSTIGYDVRPVSSPASGGGPTVRRMRRPIVNPWTRIENTTTT